MTQPSQPAQGFSVTPEDILNTLFKHKWKLIFFILLGFAGAYTVFTIKKPLYQSHAKLLIRYVTDKRTLPSGGPGDDMVRSPDAYGNTIINSEIEILTSQDLARLTARAIGPAKIRPGAEDPENEFAAAVYIRDHLKVEVGRNSAVMSVVFSHQDPQVAKDTLRRLIDEYLLKHIEVHRAIGTYEMIQGQTDQLRSRLADTEESLRKEKAKAGIISITEAKQDINTRLAFLRSAALGAEADAAQLRAQIETYTRGTAGTTNGAAASTPEADARRAPDPAKVASYQQMKRDLVVLRTREAELRLTYKPGSRPLQQVEQQITEAEKAIRELEAEAPELALRPVTPLPGSPEAAAGGFDLDLERSRLAASEAKLQTLKEQLSRVTREAETLDAAENTIAQLQRKKELEEEQYRYFQATLERARLDQALDSGKINNISLIQEPGFPRKDMKALQKLLLIAFAGPIGFGFVLVFGLELFLDPRIKRGKELESSLNVPIAISIPDFTANGRGKGKALALEDSKDGALVVKNGEAVPWDQNDPMLPYYEALRDRIVMSYSGDAHKPKIVGLTSCNHGAGVTRLATGLAAALSRDAERNVLLIGLERNRVSVSGFSKGRPTDELPETSEPEVQEDGVKGNLYSLATTGRNLAGASIAQSFTELLPKLKTSEYDYIVFDLPPINQISGSIRLVGQMERTLIVAEAERTSKDSLVQAKRVLSGIPGQMLTVLNKTRTYAPGFLVKES
jgi:polysaccharide biosynthesis transport protein